MSERTEMTRVVNTSYQNRTWPDLTDSETGRTLQLNSGEEAEVELPEDFDDVWLQPAVKSPRKPPVAPEVAPESLKTSTETVPPVDPAKEL
jgi:hypothetical protein